MTIVFEEMPTPQAPPSNNDRLFWLAIYRAVMAIAAAIKRYKLAQVDIEEETM